MMIIYAVIYVMYFSLFETIKKKPYANVKMVDLRFYVLIYYGKIWSY